MADLTALQAAAVAAENALNDLKTQLVAALAQVATLTAQNATLASELAAANAGAVAQSALDSIASQLNQATVAYDPSKAPASGPGVPAAPAA